MNKTDRDNQEKLIKYAFEVPGTEYPERFFLQIHTSENGTKNCTKGKEHGLTAAIAVE